MRKTLHNKTTKEKVSSNFFTNNKRKSSIKFLCKFDKGTKCTCIIRHLTSSFRNKPLMAFDWSSKLRKRHCRLLKCDQGKRIRWKIFFWKEYYFWYYTCNIFNFNKYFVHIIFLFVLLILQNHLRNLCVQTY